MGQSLYSAIRSAAVAATALSALFSAYGACAAVPSDDTLVEGAKLCTRYLPRHEREYGIPVHLLAAIASAESGRYHHALELNLPWPWTINVEGKGYFFDTKEEAIAAVQSLQRRGVRSIDVGCMQVSLLNHPDAFATLDQAFDPAYNVAYAAQFLKEKYEQEGSWRAATADYHSHTPIYGQPYAREVFDVWGRILNKVAAARAGKPILNTRVAKTVSPPTTQIAVASKPKQRNVFHVTPMHEISVSRNGEVTRERGVLVIRPHHETEPAVQQQASLDNDFVSQTVKAANAAPTGPQIVKIAPQKVSAKGQFQPMHSAPSAANTSAPGDSPTKNMFVFDN